MGYKLGAICRDDACKILGLHPPHRLPKALAVKVSTKPRKVPPWALGDRHGLLGAIMRATSKRAPTGFAEIANAVRNDYGSCEDRTVSRGLAVLVERGQLLKLDVRLERAAYLRPKSKLAHDLGAVREHMELLAAASSSGRSYRRASGPPPSAYEAHA